MGTGHPLARQRVGDARGKSNRASSLSCVVYRPTSQRTLERTLNGSLFVVYAIA